MTIEIIKKNIIQPPHSIEAEQSVIGALLLDNPAWDVAGDLLSESDFYHTRHKIIFRAISGLTGEQKPFDLLIVADALKNSKMLDLAGGEPYLYEICGKTYSTANIAAYAAIVRDHAVTRKIIQAANELLEAAHDGKTSAELLEVAESKIFAIANQSVHRAEPVKFDKIGSKTFEAIAALSESKSELTGVATGFGEIDFMTCGLQPSDLIIIAGRPSMGKTAFAMNIAENAVLGSDATVLVFSLEMSSEQLAKRLISSCGKVNQTNLRKAKLAPDEWARLGDATSTLSRSQLYIDDSAGLTPSDVRARARRLHRECGGISLIIVDYLQLLHVPEHNKNRVQEISEITRKLKMLAKELNVPVIALSQLNRNVESRTDKRPVMSDLRDSGEIEQAADVVAFIYRDDVYNEQSLDKGLAEIIVSKQRNGPTGKIKLKFSGEYARFSNLPIVKNFNQQF